MEFEICEPAFHPAAEPVDNDHHSPMRDTGSSELGKPATLDHASGPHGSPAPMKTLSTLALGLAALLHPCARAQDAEPPPPRQIAGDIKGVHWTATVANPWQGFLLLEEPSARESSQSPVGDEARTSAADSLLESGWAVATIGTSPRATTGNRIETLRALRDELAARLGCPRLAIVAGEGTGGLIATLMAERHPDEFHGFLARNPLLQSADSRARCDHQPRGPLLFLCDEATLPAVQDYLERAGKNANAESTSPTYWYQPAADEDTGLDREAIEALAEWIESREAPESRPPEAAAGEKEPEEDTAALPDSQDSDPPEAEEPEPDPASAEEEPPTVEVDGEDAADEP